MFDNISRRYDFLNHFLSLGIDRLWRKKAIKLLQPYHPVLILDVATGTGDFALEAMKIPAATVMGIDISEGMLEKGREKVIARGFSERIDLQPGDSEDMVFENDTFDAITAGFGVRNFEKPEKGLSEMYRVLKKGGVVCVLEFSRPSCFPVKQLYWFYFKAILPLFGRIVSRDRSAYHYLPESVYEFPDGPLFLEKLRDAGFTDVKQKKQTLGIATIYTGVK